MFKPLELFIGLRYTRSKHKNHYISFISLASMLGIMIGVLALITVLSVMNGFEKELRERILGMVSHVTVSGTDGKLSSWQALDQQLATNNQVEGIAPYIQQQVMISANGEVRGVLMQGIQPERQSAVSKLEENMLDGSLDTFADREYMIAIGRELANSIGAFIGDKVTVITPSAKVTPAGVLPRMKRFTVSAIYKMNMRDYDSSTAFIHMDDAARLFKMKGQVSGLRIRLDDLFEAQSVANTLQNELGDEVKVSDWGRDNKTFFSAIRMEKTMMFFILLLIVVVAAFNLVSSLVMVVNDKQADIAILRTLGISPNSIKKIFMIQGSIIGVSGAILGAIGGVLLAGNLETIIPALEDFFGAKIFPEDIFYISKVPSELHMSDVWMITVAALVLAVLATIYPANRAAAVQPAESLRYE
ncbi:lipoprotein-releasing ABC transporter permease subunit [Leucothrix pacifica]|uniref:Lipoprotein-releasing ABC transporter permease subunit n=1 Tax=Leucothrix pacifica TaxID=1247513 RepID=A0A317CP68_9GAMM|nr:lipoprotein-releasing ABC transporter permease subunit [Leucothrix pacifica]PWR00339.1 lipoprotein-releasing ABC transporter permease subunit [Leucothrix pacifica]